MYIVVLMIYLLSVYQFYVYQFLETQKKEKTNGSLPRGKMFYRNSAIINFVILVFGVPAWNFFVGNLDPAWLYYVGVAGFGLIGIYAMTCVYKSITTCNP